MVTAGGLVGAAAAVGYAALMLWGLRTLWVGAVGTRFLFLDVTPASLLVGFGVSVLLAAGAVWWGLRALRGTSVRARCWRGKRGAGPTTDAAVLREGGSRSFAAGLAAGLLAVAAALGLIPNREAFAGFGWDVIAFFLTGMLLLAGGAGGAGLVADPPAGRRAAVRRSALGLRNAARRNAPAAC